jgi:hypothetical protein
MRAQRSQVRGHRSVSDRCPLIAVLLFPLTAVLCSLISICAAGAYVGTSSLGNNGTFIGSANVRAAAGAVIQTLTNAQKLSLPANTAVGTQVKVSDGFVVSGSDATSFVLTGFWFQTGTQSGKPTYGKVGQDSAFSSAYYELGSNWWLDNENSVGAINAASGSEDYPWLADWSVSGDIVLTYPAVQQLTAPSSAQGGVFVSGGTQNGIYTKRGTHASKSYFNLIGFPDDDGSNVFAYAFLWTTDINIAFGIGPSSPGFIIASADGSLLYYSLSAVATPDLASNWKNASDDSPASITVTSASAGQIAAGMKFGSVFYAVATPVNGRNAYHDVLSVAPDFTFNGTIWTDGTHNGTGAPAFPWDVTGISIVRDDVCAEPNWEIVP